MFGWMVVKKSALTGREPEREQHLLHPTPHSLNNRASRLLPTVGSRLLILQSPSPLPSPITSTCIHDEAMGRNVGDSWQDIMSATVGDMEQ